MISGSTNRNTNNPRSVRRNCFILLASLLVLSCENDEKKVNALFNKKLGVDEAINIESFMSQGGKMKAKLTAPLMLRYQDTSSRVELPKTLHVDFYDSTMLIESKLDAGFATYYETRNFIFLDDSIRVYNIKGDTLFCKELTWDQSLGRFHTQKPVRIHTPDMIMYGEGLSAPQDFKTFEIFKVTNSVIRVKE
ncbi:MAG: LPS export ABC transporter periplasmic protein LptC [Chitinophagia bacterium]|nr:LPS export ABC transporter periplasmic protein LptC [Chitinophagia bacterium]